MDDPWTKSRNFYRKTINITNRRLVKCLCVIDELICLWAMPKDDRYYLDDFSVTNQSKDCLCILSVLSFIIHYRTSAIVDLIKKDLFHAIFRAMWVWSHYQTLQNYCNWLERSQIVRNRKCYYSNIGIKLFVHRVKYIKNVFSEGV